MMYKSYCLQSLRQIPQIKKLTEQQKLEIEVTGSVFPFKVNNYVLDELIDWENVPNDPIFLLTFPLKGMLKDKQYADVEALSKQEASKGELKEVVNRIRLQLNPHPAQQMLNIPEIGGQRLSGVQHKYRETILFFPGQGQTCHAYCTFCFRWPQFVGIDTLKFATRETQAVIEYIREHPKITDILFTGGDPLVMKAKTLGSYIDAFLDAKLPNLRTIRIGTKALGYWPYRFLTDSDSSELLTLFEKVKKAGKHLTIMAHFSHPVELKTEAARKAIDRIRDTGAEIRTQSPLIKNINDSAEIWTSMWNEQVNLGCIPYYMFVERDTGAQPYFAVPLVKAWDIFRKAYLQVSGIARTVKGPVMSCTPGKVQVIGITEFGNEKVFVLTMIQGRNPEWVHKPFFAKYNANSVWIDDLKPAFGEDNFFFEKELRGERGNPCLVEIVA